MIDRRASVKTDHVVAVSGALADHMAKFVAYPQRISVIPNGVDTARFAPDRADHSALVAELGIAPSSPLIGSTGRFDPVKGYDVLIRAFAAMLERWHGMDRPTLILVGDGPEDHMLRSLATDLGVDADVRFLRWRGDIERIVASLDLFALASHSEGTSVSLLEAMSAGVCPVVTDVGGNAAVLGPALAHRLVPPASPDKLALVLRDGLTDEHARRRDGVAARARVVGEFSLDRAVRKYEDLYRRAIATAR